MAQTPFSKSSEDIGEYDDDHEEYDGESDEPEKITSENPPSTSIVALVAEPILLYDSDSGSPNLITTTTTTTKRPHVEVSNSISSSKRRNKSKTNPNEGKSTPSPNNHAVVVRVWNDEDVIMLLRGSVDYKDLTGKDPNSEITDFYEKVKGKLQGDYSKEQVRSKMNSIKFNYMKKTRFGSTDRIFSKPHNSLVFKLSRKLFAGSPNMFDNATPVKDTSIAKKCSTPSKKVNKDNTSASISPREGIVNTSASISPKEGITVEKKEENFQSIYPFLSASFDDCASSAGLSAVAIKLVKENLNLIGSEKAKDLNTKWKQLLIEKMDRAKEQMELSSKMAVLEREQIELTSKMSGLVRDQVTMVFELMNQH